MVDRAGTYGTTDLALNYSQQVGRFDVLATASLETTGRGIAPQSVSAILHDRMHTGTAFVRVAYLAHDHDGLALCAEIPIEPTLLPLSRAPLGAVCGPDEHRDPRRRFVPHDANPIERERNLFAAPSYARHRGRRAAAGPARARAACARPAPPRARRRTARRTSAAADACAVLSPRPPAGR